MNIIEKNYSWNSELVQRPKTTEIIVHHSAAKSCSADDVHRWHLENGWAGIGYHFFVRKNGKVYRGRPEDVMGAQASGHNDTGIGVCFEGDYMVEQTMPEAQYKAGQELLAYLHKRYPSATIKRHKDVNSTDCPGKYFPFDSMKSAAIVSYAVEAAEKAVQTAIKKGVCNMELPILKQGMKNASVKAAQTLLIANGCSCGIYRNDGDFGAATEKAVKKFQEKKKLTVDGIIGANTWAKLLK